MRLHRIATSLLLSPPFGFAADISEYVVAPRAIEPLFNVDALPQTIARRQNGTEVCKAYPGDANWPSDAAWSAFNASLGGALINPIPRAAVCHSSWPAVYDQQKCQHVLDNWNNHAERVADPTDLIYLYFQGESCYPSTNASTPCTNGGSPAYIVNATTPEQISAAIKFAKDNNVRLVIKNTGHDVGGRSTGEGSLSIWTHNMKQIDWLPDYKSDYYSGAAIRAAAGVALGDYYRAAEDHGVTVVGGECSTVGVAGGYTAGGGHSPVGGLFGMGADNIVELTAVLPNGTHAHITPSSAPDLFWAFRGGGGSTFGVVTSVTVKTHPKVYTTVSQWNFNNSVVDNTTSFSNETFWKAVRAYMEHIPAIADSGSQSFAGVTPSKGGFEFRIYSFVAPNITTTQYDGLMAPYFAKLSKLGINPVQNITFHDSYYTAWQRAFPKISSPWDPNKPVVSTGSRLFPRKNFEDPARFEDTLAALKKITNLGYSFIFYAQRNSLRPGTLPNAINPAYRDSAIFMMVSGTYPMGSSPDKINSVRNTVTKVLVPILKSVTPGSGAYMNEADVREDDWQQSFFGSSYPRLLKIKNELDPERVFWAKTTVGSEDWYIQDDRGLPEVGMGRLCRRV